MWFRKRIEEAAKDQTVDYIFSKIGNGQSKRIAPNKEYIQLSIETMRVVSAREWTSKYHGAVHVDLGYRREMHGMVELQAVIAPDTFQGIDAGNLDRIIMQNLPLIGPIPYEGDLRLSLGLFSVKGDDLAAPYLDLLSSLTKKVGGFVEQAAALMEPLRDGMSLLFGDVGASELEIGVQTNWTDAETGLYLLIRAPVGTLDPATLSYNKDTRQLLDNAGAPIIDYPYIVLRVDAPEARPDWYENPLLKQAWQKVKAADEANNRQLLDELLRQFSVQARYSPDLIPSHAELLVEKLTALTQGLYEAPSPPNRRLSAAANQGQPVRSSTAIPELESIDLFG